MFEIKSPTDVATLMQMFTGGNNNPAPKREPLPETPPEPQPAHGGMVDDLVRFVPELVSNPFATLHQVIQSIPEDYQFSAQQLASMMPASRVQQMRSDYGGLVDDVLGFVGLGNGQVAGALGAATKNALAKVAQTVENVAKYSGDNRIKINSIQASLAGYRNMITDVTRRVNGLTNDWDDRFGEAGRPWRAALAAAQALPGLRAHGVLSGSAYQEHIKAITDTAKAVNDLDEYAAQNAPTWSTVDGSVAQDIEDAITELRNEHVVLITKLNGEIKALRAALKPMGLEDHRDALDTIKVQTAPDTLTQLAGLAPDQIVDSSEAAMTAAIKLLVGKPPAQSGGILGILGI